LSLSIISSVAHAGICAYRLSELLSPEVATGVAATGGAVGAGGAAFHAAGLYIITNATTGAAMIGSTAVGVSGAGTVGIIGGTSGLLGSAAAVVSAPATMIAGAVAAVGISALEGGCYFADERITDFGQVLSILERIDAEAKGRSFQLFRSTNEAAYIMINYDGSGMTRFEVEDLYIVNGVLMNRDWFRNTVIGQIAVVVQANDFVKPE